MRTCGTCVHWTAGAQAAVHPGADPAYGNCEAIIPADEQRFRHPDALAFAGSSEFVGSTFGWRISRPESFVQPMYL